MEITYAYITDSLTLEFTTTSMGIPKNTYLILKLNDKMIVDVDYTHNVSINYSCDSCNYDTNFYKVFDDFIHSDAEKITLLYGLNFTDVVLYKSDFEIAEHFTTKHDNISLYLIHNKSHITEIKSQSLMDKIYTLDKKLITHIDAVRDGVTQQYYITNNHYSIIVDGKTSTDIFDYTLAIKCYKKIGFKEIKQLIYYNEDGSKKIVTKEIKTKKEIITLETLNDKMNLILELLKEKDIKI